MYTVIDWMLHNPTIWLDRREDGRSSSKRLVNHRFSSRRSSSRHLELKLQTSRRCWSPPFLWPHPSSWACKTWASSFFRSGLTAKMVLMTWLSIHKPHISTILILSHCSCLPLMTQVRGQCQVKSFGREASAVFPWMPWIARSPSPHRLRRTKNSMIQERSKRWTMDKQNKTNSMIENNPST